jgi:hypothetical protein
MKTTLALLALVTAAACAVPTNQLDPPYLEPTSAQRTQAFDDGWQACEHAHQEKLEVERNPHFMTREQYNDETRRMIEAQLDKPLWYTQQFEAGMEVCAKQYPDQPAQPAANSSTYYLLFPSVHGSHIDNLPLAQWSPQL